MVWTRSWSRGCGMSVHMEPSWHGVNSQPQLLQLLCKPVLKDNPCPSDCVTDKTDDGHGEGTTLREGWILCNPQEQRNLGCSRPHRTVQECPLCQLIPGMWHFWNCLCQDFLLWHLWFLRLIIGNPRSAAPLCNDFCIQQLSCLLWILKRDERAWMFPWQDRWMELV